MCVCLRRNMSVRLRSSRWKSRWHGNKYCHAAHFSKINSHAISLAWFFPPFFRVHRELGNVSLLAVFKCNSSWNLAIPHSLTHTYTHIHSITVVACYRCFSCSCSVNIRDNRLPLSSKSNRHSCFFFHGWVRWGYLMTINRRQINIISLKLCTWLVELILWAKTNMFLSNSEAHWQSRRRRRRKTPQHFVETTQLWV